MNSSALGVIWLPVLTSLPGPAQLPGSPALFSPFSSNTREVRSLARALCSHCSCDSDPGCLHNCEACGYKCGSCSCQDSLSCKYNCDKCEAQSAQITNDGQTHQSHPTSLLSTTTTTTTITNNNKNTTTTTTSSSTGQTEDCAGLVTAGLCGWGQLCRTIASTHFPHCHYDCQSCSNHSPPPTCLHPEEWCALGDECQQVKDDKFPGCKFDCATECPGLLELAPVLAEDFLDNEWAQFPPAESSLPHEDNAWRPPPVSPVLVDSEGADADLDQEDNAGKPPADMEEDETFSWMDIHPRASSCKADLGPAASQTCKFPFKYQGKTYFKCAPLEREMKSLSLSFPGAGWCSTLRDINGLHITGPYPDPWRYVGICGESCSVNGS